MHASTSAARAARRSSAVPATTWVCRSPVPRPTRARPGRSASRRCAGSPRRPSPRAQRPAARAPCAIRALSWPASFLIPRRWSPLPRLRPSWRAPSPPRRPGTTRAVPGDSRVKPVPRWFSPHLTGLSRLQQSDRKFSRDGAQTTQSRAERAVPEVYSVLGCGSPSAPHRRATAAQARTQPEMIDDQGPKIERHADTAPKIQPGSTAQLNRPPEWTRRERVRHVARSRAVGPGTAVGRNARPGSIRRGALIS